jgi:hypothetical protein
MSRPTPEQRARAVCGAMDGPMRRMGVMTTAHYDLGIPLIATAIYEAERAAALEMRTLLKELGELRTLCHDLLLDRDAAYGREVGRGEALATVEEIRRQWRERAADPESRTAGLALQNAAALEHAINRVHALGPVRPLPPPGRLAARCRALEDALRDLVAGHLNEMTARGLPHEWAPDSPMGRAVRLLEENSADE